MRGRNRGQMENEILDSIESADEIIRKRRYLDQLGQTGRESTAIYAADITRRTLRYWRRSEQFREDEEDAIETYRDRIEYEITRRAMNPADPASVQFLMTLIKAERPRKFSVREYAPPALPAEKASSTVRFVELPEPVLDIEKWTKRAQRVVEAQAKPDDGSKDGGSE